MKKNLLTVLVAMMIMVLVGCGKGNEQTANSEEATTAQEKKVTYQFETELETLEQYRGEVIRRNSSGKYETSDEGEEIFIKDNFLSEEEIKFFKENGMSVRNDEDGYISFYNELYHETSEYYYPVLVSEGESTFLWYTSEYGDVAVKEFEEGFGSPLGSSDWMGSLNYEPTEDQEIIDEVINCCLVYNEETGEIQKWSFGELNQTYQVPEGSLYVGLSEWEGYLFRSGTDVYALQGNGVVVIAHNVEQVLVADYYYTSDCFSQPMFLMTDGSVKVYVGWDGDQSKPDAIDHLQDPVYEGGYH